MIFELLRFLLAPVRFVMGGLIQLYDRLFSAQLEVNRSPEQQAQVDAEMRQWKLYHFQACPFCVKVRRQIRRLGFKIELRDVKRNPDFERELMQGGGEIQVPCLRIPQSSGSDRWLYESSEINAFLKTKA
ncbi:glutaredoxin [Bdellovibrionota bacterium FG-1]